MLCELVLTLDVKKGSCLRVDLFRSIWRDDIGAAAL